MVAQKYTGSAIVKIHRFSWDLTDQQSASQLPLMQEPTCSMWASMSANLVQMRRHWIRDESYIEEWTSSDTDPKEWVCLIPNPSFRQFR
jgi:hypothetical protein